MPKIKTVFRLLLFLLILYTFLRVLFLLTYFSNAAVTANELVRIFYWGFRLDLAVLILINIPLWIYLLFIAEFIKRPGLNRKLSTSLFLLVNLPFLLLNIIDLAYFNFNLRRSTLDLFTVLKDSEHAWGMFISRYWFLLLLFIGLVVLIWAIADKIFRKTFSAPAPGLRKVGKINWV